VIGLVSAKRDAVSNVLAAHNLGGHPWVQAQLSMLILDAIDAAVENARLAAIVRPADDPEDEYDSLYDAITLLDCEDWSVFAFLQGPDRVPKWAVPVMMDLNGEGYVTDFEIEVFEMLEAAEAFSAKMKVEA
jgi:hypothetical protein